MLDSAAFFKVTCNEIDAQIASVDALSDWVKGREEAHSKDASISYKILQDTEANACKLRDNIYEINSEACAGLPLLLSTCPEATIDESDTDESELPATSELETGSVSTGTASVGDAVHKTITCRDIDTQIASAEAISDWAAGRYDIVAEGRGRAYSENLCLATYYADSHSCWTHYYLIQFDNEICGGTATLPECEIADAANAAEICGE